MAKFNYREQVMQVSTGRVGVVQYNEGHAFNWVRFANESCLINDNDLVHYITYMFVRNDAEVFFAHELNHWTDIVSLKGEKDTVKNYDGGSGFVSASRGFSYTMMVSYAKDQQNASGGSTTV